MPSLRARVLLKITPIFITSSVSHLECGATTSKHDYFKGSPCMSESLQIYKSQGMVQENCILLPWGEQRSIRLFRCVSISSTYHGDKVGKKYF